MELAVSSTPASTGGLACCSLLMRSGSRLGQRAGKSCVLITARASLSCARTAGGVLSIRPVRLALIWSCARPLPVSPSALHGRQQIGVVDAHLLWLRDGDVVREQVVAPRHLRTGSGRVRTRSKEETARNTHHNPPASRPLNGLRHHLSRKNHDLCPPCSLGQEACPALRQLQERAQEHGAHPAVLDKVFEVHGGRLANLHWHVCGQQLQDARPSASRAQRLSKLCAVTAHPAHRASTCSTRTA